MNNLPTSEKLKAAVANVIGPLDSEVEIAAAAPPSGETIILVRLDADLTESHLRRIQNRVEDLVADEFGMTRDEWAHHRTER